MTRAAFFTVLVLTRPCRQNHKGTISAFDPNHTFQSHESEGQQLNGPCVQTVMQHPNPVLAYAQLPLNESPECHNLITNDWLEQLLHYRMGFTADDTVLWTPDHCINPQKTRNQLFALDHINLSHSSVIEPPAKLAWLWSGGQMKPLHYLGRNVSGAFSAAKLTLGLAYEANQKSE